MRRQGYTGVLVPSDRSSYLAMPRTKVAGIPFMYMTAGLLAVPLTKYLYGCMYIRSTLIVTEDDDHIIFY
jgi:hypothetical protein